MSDRTITAAIKKALYSRFSAPEWACFMEVAQGTGATSGRSADCVAMNLFPSRGLRVHGVEVKASRSDWLRELKDPAKAEPIMRFCDHWWIAAKAGVVVDGELPPTWGLLEMQGTVLRQKVAAPKLEAQPMDRPFIAALLRRASERAGRELHEAVADKLAGNEQVIADRVKREVDMRNQKLRSLEASIADFEERSGITFDQYAMGDIGAAVKLLRDTSLVSRWGSTLQHLASQARTFADRADTALAEFGAKQEDDQYT
jgi:hypothetical protein